MKPMLYFSLLLLTSCSQKPRSRQESNLPVVDPPSAQKFIPPESKERDTTEYQTAPFKLIKDYPLIKDSAYFISELKKNCHIGWDYFGAPNEKSKKTINVFEKIKIYGSNKQFYLIEYDWHGNGPNNEYPWKRQYLFDIKGKFIKVFQGIYARPIKIFPGQNPFLTVLLSSARGNGGHEIYKVSGDTLENVYEGYYNYETQTYCADENEHWKYEPDELKLTAKDFNKDGISDLCFEGKLVLVNGLTATGIWYDYTVLKTGDTLEYSSENPFKKQPLRYVFTYNKKTGHFQLNNKYSIKNPFADD